MSFTLSNRYLYEEVKSKVIHLSNKEGLVRGKYLGMHIEEIPELDQK